MIFYGYYGEPLSRSYIQDALFDYEDGYLRWRDMDDGTKDAIEHELRKRKQKKRAREEEARNQKREARIQKVETWINSFDTFHTLTEIKVEPRKLQKISTPIAPLQSSSTPVPLVPKTPPPPPASLPSPLKPAAPVLSLPDDLVPSIILEETSKHEKEDFSPPIDPFDSGPIWDKEDEEKLPKAAALELPIPIEPPLVPIVDVPSPFSGLLEEDADSRSNPFKGEEDDVIMETKPNIFYHVRIEEEETYFKVLPKKESKSKKSLKSFNLTFRHLLSILAQSGCTKFQWRPINSCWKDNSKGCNFLEDRIDQIHFEDTHNGRSFQQQQSGRI